MDFLDEWQSPAWRGTPCTSDAWPFSPDIAVFEARRAIGQLVRTYGDGVNPPGLDPSDVDPVLRYIRAARDLEEVMRAVRQDLVAEARARGLTWEMIGRSEGTGRRAAQKAYRAGLSDGRLEQLRIEAFVSWLARQAVKPRQPPERVSSDLDGSTPLDRLAYLVRHAWHALSEIDKLLASAESDPENALDILERPCRRIERAITAVTVDHAMWEAMAGWSGQPEAADRANYHTSTTYLLHVMRLLLFALLYAPEEGSADIDHFRVFLTKAEQVYASVLLILERPDVGWAIPAPE
ncbi:hypothetical protein ACGFI4_14225 [Micromonospora carbonacea]|uniref:hypothetical protein n=1 Tax=Micromonospora carbonacea TaxID=47853 RepID=UPI00371C7C24